MATVEKQERTAEDGTEWATRYRVRWREPQRRAALEDVHPEQDADNSGPRSDGKDRPNSGDGRIRGRAGGHG
jgi:hypothetical protein